MKQNKHCYKDVLLWAQEYNIEASSDYMLFASYDSSLSNLGCRLSLGEVKSIVSDMCDYEDTRNEMIEAAEKKSANPDDKICPVCQSSLCVSNTGDVYPCEGWQRLVLGNLSEERLVDIWEKSSIVRKLRDLKVKDFPKCLSCDNRKYCSTCLLMNANESCRGDYRDVNDFVCGVAHIKKSILENM